MTKILSIVLALLISGCTGCATVQPASESAYGNGDRNEQAIQHVMKQAVGIKIRLAIPEPAKEKGKVSLGFRWSAGSGVVVGYDSKTGHSLVLTAGHVCNTPESITIPIDENTGIELPVLWDNFYVINHKGERLMAVPLVNYEKADICALDVVGWAGEVATIASSLPPMGGKLVTSGAPQGSWGRGFSPYQEGVYFGLTIGIDDDHPESVLMGTSIPGVRGMSGSGVYYHGKLVGILTMVANKYEHSSYLVNVVDVYDLLVEAHKKWPSPKNMSQSQK